MTHKPYFTTLFICLCLGAIVVSCKKNQHDVAAVNDNPQQFENKIAFAKSLAKALTKKTVRELIKGEAVKQIDKDYDVLYQMVKDNQVEPNKTLADYLSGEAGSTTFTSMVDDKLPLITIFVPRLKNFSADDWDTDNQIPIVGVRNEEDIKAGKKMLAFDAQGNQYEMAYNSKPDRPIVIVKTNERVEVLDGPTATTRSAIASTILYEKKGKAFYFRYPDFDGRNVPPYQPASKQEATENSQPNAREAAVESYCFRTTDYARYDFRAQYAFEHNITCARDYIYYGIDPANGVNQGPFNSNYAEFITSVRINDMATRDRLVDDMTDGNMEFDLTFFFIQDKTGVNSLKKGFSLVTDELFITDAQNPAPNPKAYTLSAPVEIIPFDMQKYGDTWKIAVYEYDPGTTSSYTSTMTSTYGGNFTVSGTIQKVGLSFGGSATETHTQTVTTTVTGTSDDLLDALHTYCDPILIEKGASSAFPCGWSTGGRPPRGGWGRNYEVSTGKVSFSIETRARF
ncbi:hypothetical protein A4H97_14750 [Niastella yeongjuensis]|uniref:Uncharacterized protein n=1 Tax=Niastella yeongjuensis TaxID=354355 RepID=A0A1V9E4M1_9BACT|nr:hypothetical protein [Niastella yeongjuensis]OQP40865.1 hypothetical protein A4H97_14750 [Niastella yeongjuensis]SEO99442.1 hypothetical protein SAMN05660816_04101 [Niastella yeongjuensis]